MFASQAGYEVEARNFHRKITEIFLSPVGCVSKYLVPEISANLNVCYIQNGCSSSIHLNMFFLRVPYAEYDTVFFCLGKEDLKFW